MFSLIRNCVGRISETSFSFRRWTLMTAVAASAGEPLSKARTVRSNRGFVSKSSDRGVLTRKTPVLGSMENASKSLPAIIE